MVSGDEEKRACRIGDGYDDRAVSVLDRLGEVRIEVLTPQGSHRHAVRDMPLMKIDPDATGIYTMSILDGICGHSNFSSALIVFFPQELLELVRPFRSTHRLVLHYLDRIETYWYNSTR